MFSLVLILLPEGAVYMVIAWPASQLENKIRVTKTRNEVRDSCSLISLMIYGRNFERLRDPIKPSHELVYEDYNYIGGSVT